MDLQVLNSEILESPVLLSLASHIDIPQAPQSDGSILMSGTAPLPMPQETYTSSSGTARLTLRLRWTLTAPRGN